MIRDHEPFNMSATPISIAKVKLKVRDIETMTDFYRRALGLSIFDTGGSQVSLGAGGSALLELEGDASLELADPRQAGLFHTAFLLPAREDLGRWLRHAAATRVAVQGAADHLVSEALYLADPEGNGIEIYVDHPTDHWRDERGDIQMATDPLDVQDLVHSAGSSEWEGFPEAGTIGHVHLQVGDLAQADAFYEGVLGMDVALRYPGANFYGSGGYHHQLAGNVWNSRRAGKRPAGMAGLAEVTLRTDATKRDEIVGRAGSDRFDDPWGTTFVLSNRSK